MNSNNLDEQKINPEIIELIQLGNDWNKAFPGNTTLFRVGEPTSREEIRERLRESLNRHKELIKNLTNQD